MYGFAGALVLSSAASFAAEDAEALRADVEALNRRIEALEQDTEREADPAWTDRIKIKGDLRARFEHREKGDQSDKSRLRGRARVGVYADVNDQVYAGVRIATGSDDSPTSTNQTLDDFGEKRAIWLDLMYMGYTPDYIEGLDLVLGKIKQPWEQVSDLMYDSDVNPEGANAGYLGDYDAFDLIANLGYYIWQEEVDSNPASDITMGAAQLAGRVGMGDNLALIGGVNAFVYHNVAGAATPLDAGDNPLPEGNTTVTVGTDEVWVYDYELLEGFAQLDLDNDIAPVKVYGDYIVNTASEVEEDTAWLVGAGTGYKRLGFDYSYREIDADAIIGVLADSDFSEGGTGGKGHKFKLKYKLLSNWTAGLTYFVTEDAGGTDVNTLQADLVVKF
jgi:hypothetical protein